ncbi:MAG: hypothetical protein A2Y40_04875 [Candidatus Margulisbacteria bacterium GWF2_35_9]|nr:MAG: hypothetical protein A2Y40_04875 [Candidatus Margulisbacteria bacterium GWF2_35_9]
MVEWSKIDSMSHAAKHGDVETVSELLQSVDVNTLNREGCSVLMVASKWGKTEIIDFLLSYPKTNINLKDKEGNTALFYAVRYGKTDVMKQLLTDINIGVNSINKNKVTSLMIAALKGNKEAVEVLINAPDIDINLEDESEQTAMIKAAHGGYIDVINVFLSRPEIKVNIEDKIEQTALGKAAKQGHLEIVKELVAREDNTIRNLSTSLLNATDNAGEIIKEALENMLNKYKSMTENALEIVMVNAVSTGNIKFVELLMRYSEVNENIKNREGKSLLHIAVECGHVNIVKFLLSQPDIKKSIDAKGTVLLEKAVINSNRKMFKALLSHSSIIMTNEIEIVIYSALEIAAAAGDKELVRDLLAYPNINMKSCREYKKYPMFKAVQNTPNPNILISRLEDVQLNKYLETVAILWAAGDNTKSKDPRFNQVLRDSFLFLAIVGEVDLFRALIENGADINCKNEAGYTALMYAVIYKHVQIVRVLCLESSGLKRLLSGTKLNIDAKNNEGYTALAYAKIKERFEIEAILKRAGAKG